MSEGLASQIVIVPTESFFPVKGLSLKKVGRKRIINSEMYLNVIKKIHSIKDHDVADELGCSRPTVYRYRVDPINKDIINEAEKIVLDFEGISFSEKMESFDYYFNLPTIQEWYMILKDIRRVGDETTMRYIRSFGNICKYLKKHPKKIDLDDCSKLNIKIKNLYYDNKELPNGLNYQGVRESIRSFFMNVRGISGAILSQKGITKENLPTYGRYSKQYVPKEVRHKFEETLKDVMNSYDEYLELLELARFMYYTATRITASLEFNFDENRYELNKDMWLFEVIDKGMNGGVKWEKYLIGHALDSFKEYCSKRFKIPINELDEKLPYMTDHLFPSFMKDGIARYDLVRYAFKLSLIKAGLNYKEFPPTHIWRHTFAQDFLASSNWNYELCASLGGWKSTYILKKHYGEMGLHPKISGLKRSMGIPVEEETYELRW